jgi:hypothetical protein
MKKFYNHNHKKQCWELVEIEPKFKINNGTLPISILKTLKNPHNIKSYTTLDEKSNVKSLIEGQNVDDTFSMKKRLDDGLIPNSESIKICPITGIIWSGHNRLDGGIEINAKEMKVLEAIRKGDFVEINIKYNKKDELII